MLGAENNNNASIIQRARNMRQPAALENGGPPSGSGLAASPTSRSAVGRRRSSGLNHEPTISMANMPNALSMSQRREKSISFSGVSYVIDTLLSARGSANQRQKEADETIKRGEDVRRLLESPENADKSISGYLATSAIRIGDFDRLKEILNITLNNNSNPGASIAPSFRRLLHVAAEVGTLEMCTFLVNEAGFSASNFEEATVDSTSNGGVSAGCKETPLHCAARGNKAENLALLHEQAGGDLNVCEDSNSVMPLHVAVAANSLEVVTYLLSKGAITMSSVKFSSTPLHVAAEFNSVRCAEALLASNVLVDALRGERQRETPLHLASSQGYAGIAEVLLRAGADPNAKNGRDETPLHLASKVHSCGLMRLLIQKEADVDAQDVEGRPPLHWVINSKQKGGRECMRTLLDAGAGINLADNTGMTALHIAAVNAKKSRLDLLIEAGADLCARNLAGQSTLQFCMKHLPHCTISAVEKRLDNSIKMYQHADSELDAEIQLNFEPLLPRALLQGGGSTAFTKPRNNSMQKAPEFRSEVELFSEILRLKQPTDSNYVERLLMHPLSQGYLHLKWSQIQKLYFVIIVLSHFIYSAVYSVYAISVFRYLCPPTAIVRPKMRDFNFNVTEFLTPTYIQCEEDPGTLKTAQAMWILLILFTIVYVAKEATKAIHLRLRYLWEYESWLNVAIILSFPLISFHTNPFSSTHLTIQRWQYHVTAVGVFTTWVLQMLLIGRMPRFGIYVEVFKKVSWTFINFLIAYIFLFVAFSMSFIILFPDHPAFATPSPGAIVKVFSMMLGEIEYDDLYYPQRLMANLSDLKNHSHFHIEEETVEQFFPVSAQILVAAFILFVSIIIMNLLFGLAVADIQALYKVARLHQLIQQVELISYMERMLFSPIFVYLPDWLQRHLRRPLQGLRGNGGYQYKRTFSPNDSNRQLFPDAISKEIYNKAKELHLESPENKSSLEDKVNLLSEQLLELRKILLETRTTSMASSSGSGSGSSDSAGSKFKRGFSMMSVASSVMDDLVEEEEQKSQGSK